jgi:ABC-type Fe3+ transport system permease subunit
MLAGRFRRTSCPSPAPGQPHACVRTYYFLPLVGFLVPTIAIAYGIVLPRNGVTGVNELTVGFAATLIGAAVTYVIGVVMAGRR